MNHRLPASPHPRAVAARFEDARQLDAQHRSGWSRWLVLGAGLIALTMLAAFYSIVSGGVQRATISREQARAEQDRQLVCQAVSSPSSRDSCFSNVVGSNVVPAISPVAYGTRARGSARTASTSGTYDTLR